MTTIDHLYLLDAEQAQAAYLHLADYLKYYGLQGSELSGSNAGRNLARRLYAEDAYGPAGPEQMLEHLRAAARLIAGEIGSLTVGLPEGWPDVQWEAQSAPPEPLGGGMGTYPV